MSKINRIKNFQPARRQNPTVTPEMVRVMVELNEAGKLEDVFRCAVAKARAASVVGVMMRAELAPIMASLTGAMRSAQRLYCTTHSAGAAHVVRAVAGS